MVSNIDSRISGKPIFFERNRVYRVYKGGKLFHDFFNGEDPPEDGNEPEEWIASDVKALNNIQKTPRDGVSIIKRTNIYFDDLIAENRKSILGDRDSLGILVKVLDSGIRLPVQAHPDKAFSRQHFSSDYGKAEAWVVLATRENACLYMGFKNAVTPEEFRAVCERSETDKDCIEPFLNRVPAAVGDVFFIPAGLVHAIGYGCLILEIQEPTDFTIQPEAWCGDYHLNEYEKYLGLSADIAFKCFDFNLYGEKAIKKARKNPATLYNKDGIEIQELISSQDTDCFGLKRYILCNGMQSRLLAPAIYIVTAGNGCLNMETDIYELSRGDYFLLPDCVNGECSVEGSLEIVQCIPPQQENSK